MELYRMTNSDGMQAYASYVVFNDGGELIACDIIGAEVVVRTVLTTRPALYRWHVVPVVSPNPELT